MNNLRFKNLSTLLLLTLLGFFPSFSQEQDLLGMEPTELGDGFTLVRQRASTETAYNGQAFEFQYDEWEKRDFPGESGQRIKVRLLHGVFSNDTELALAWQAVNRTNAPKEPLELGGNTGDVDLGLFPSHVRMLKDHAIYIIDVSANLPNTDFPEEAQVELMSRLKDTALSKIEALHLASLPAFNVDFVIVSPVNPVEVDVRSNDQVSYFASLKNLDAQTSEILEEWKIEEGGQFQLRLDDDLDSGNYELIITVRDQFQRTKTFHHKFLVQESLPDPTTETRAVSKDALVSEKNPHSNEGANPRLTLEKINGKAARDLLGFDLSGVNTNSLTSATLVLSIDPSDQVSGWGNGETVSVNPVTVAWQEGNGKKHGLPGNQQTAGSGAGTTWFSPTDENIANTSSNGVVQWNGAATYATTGTAPALTVRNNQTGELRFDVTDDVLNGVTHGWLLRKDAENKGSKVSFYSREGGGASLGPRLILEYGGQAAMSGPDKIASAVAGFFGFKRRPLSLQASTGVSEGPKGLKEFLRGSQRAAFVGEQVLLGFAGHHPLTQLGARVAYRSWLRETPSLV